MEKEPQPDSLSNVTVKEYASSEVYSSEPPPAYHRPGQSQAVQVARIAAVTIICVSFIMGTFMLASAYIQASASCSHLQQELMLLQDTLGERIQEPQALVQDEQSAQETKNIETSKPQQPENDDDDDDDNSNSIDNETPTPIRIKLPLQLDFDDLAGALIEKNGKSRMNCVVEKKRADQVIDHQPKTIPLPFGVNLTTDPRYEHVTGEKMAIYCESGNREEQPKQDDVMMHIQPIIIPIQDMQQPHPTHHMPPQHMQQQPNMQPQHMPPQHQMPPFQQRPMIPPQIIAQHIAQIQRIAAQQQQQQQQVPQYSRNNFPIPEEILTQINRLPNNDDVIAIQVSEESDEGNRGQEGRSYPQPIPIHMAPVQELNEPNLPPRPHFVHPRSVRSVENPLLPREKRVKRCACDCAC